MKSTAPLSKSQLGLYVECASHKGEVYYNIPFLYVLDKSLDGQRLADAVKTVFLAHPSLFIRIELNDDGDPVQTLDMDNEQLDLTIDEINDIEAVKQQLIHPFDLDGGRLFNVRLLHDNDHYYLFLDSHHIIVDGTTLQILLHDIDKAYRGEPIAPEELTLMQAAETEAELRETPAFEQAKQWYAQNFDCSDTFTQLTPDLAESVHTEDSVLHTTDVEVSRVDDYCQKNGIFKSNLFTSVFAYLLAKFNNENESLFNTVYNGRSDKRLSRSTGMFVKTIPVYAKFDDDTTVIDYLNNAQSQMSGCREHSIYSYSDLQQDLHLQTNVSFAWHGNLFADETLMDKPMQSIPLFITTTGTSLYVKVYLFEGKFQIEAEYASNEYSKALIEHFLESYEAILNGFISQEKLSDIELATPHQVKGLDDFNITDSPYDDTQTVVSLFRKHVAETPDATAVVYLDKSYTYAQVDDMSDRIAAYIACKGLGAEDVVSILIPRCEWMAIASLGVLKAGCAYQPLDPSYPKERLDFMMDDAKARILIADAELFSIVDDYKGEVIFTRDLPDLPATQQVPEGPNPHSMFSLIYTSGSTGVPKGCQIEQRNVVAFCHMHQNAHEINAQSRVAAYASFGFDASLMEIYSALTIGAQLHIIPEEIRLDLMALNDFFEQNGITHVFMTTQVAYQFATNFENNSLHNLLTGGEKLSTLVPPSTYTLSNGYGPSETICYVTNFDVTEQIKNIPIGKAQRNVKCYITDKHGHRLPVGAAGELWVAGPQVTRGYLNRPEKTAEVFIPNPFNNEEKYNRIYRTGDIVRYLPSGDIDFVGRRDGQVKIRGFRIELKEVESIIREFPGIKDATVQAFEEEGGGKYIVAYIVSDDTVDINAMNNFILEEKPPYMVPAVTMQIDAIPLNQNGKVNKRALPKPEKKADNGIEESNVPMNVLEEELHQIIADVVNNTEFGVTTLLGFAGLTSISAIKLAVQINKRYGITLDSKSLVKTGTMQSIENEILNKMLAGGSAPTKAEATAPAEAKTSVPLSYAQTGVYFECLKNPASTIYNIPFMLCYPADTDIHKLADAAKRVIEAHPELGVHFTTEGDAIVQTTEDSVSVEVVISEMTEEELADYKNEFVRPFNLQKAPLYRCEAVKTEKGIYLLTDAHHLVFDGGSADLYIRQVNNTLEDNPVENESYSYLDFVSDQQKAEETDTFKASQHFFAEKLQTCEGASEIPADLPKSDEQGYIGEAVCPVDFDKANAFCRKQELTPAHLFLAATSYVVSRYTNNRDVYMCTVSSGRSNLKIADTVGMFVNTLALGMNVDDVTVGEFLKQASDTFDQTLQHEDYPFARIATDYGFNPSIAYAYQVGVISQYTLNGQPIKQEVLELNVPKFKINIQIESRGVVVQYDDSIYSERVGRGLAESIVAVANRMMEQPQARVRQLSIVSPSQEEELSHLRQTATGEAPFRFFHECIGHFAQTQPDHEALVAIDGRYTYKQMDQVTNRIAAALRKRGVHERDRVALLLPRTSRLILSLFGVLKSSAAYIPCDPEYPADRVKLILEDSEARYIITTADRMDSVPADKAIDVEDLINDDNDGTIVTDINPDDLAYLIYTSGSTGRPKGVMLHHRGICNYLYGHPANVFANAVMTDAKRMLSVTTISFDAALQDIGTSFYNGKTLIVATEEQANNPLDLTRLINEEHINMVSGTPSRWMTWLTSDDFCEAISHINIVRAGGEKFSDQLLELLRKVTKARIFNCYGPTEITVASNNKELTHADVVTVGKPQLNVIEFIVDQDGNELPVGVVGELYIGGRGVAHGYNNLDKMTSERFVDYHGVRIYKSGDYAKWLPDGDVVILGRTDHQIKLRGLRIELGEIENVMLKVEGLKKVVILIRKINDKEHLCAYYTADREIKPEDLKAKISKSLTQYMVPTAYLQLKEMPMTPNGKTDVKALPEPELAISSAYVEPANDTERAFCDIFAGILQMDKVGATDNFFDLGGTSLVVTRVIIEADKAGLHIAYGDVFANPTPRKLARLITGDSANEGEDEVAGYDYTTINNMLQGNTLDAFRHGERKPLGNVLLTGSTGYLGIHILRELIDSDAKNIYCLVRGKSEEAAASRLRTLLFYYFSDAFKELFGSRLHIVLGDVTSDFSEGLDVDTVFNCAAIVKHFSEGTEIEDVNIGGAQRCVDYCLKNGATLVHVSTASTRGLWVGEPKSDIFTEQRLYLGQYLGNKYIYSKFMAERLILDAVANHGLSAKIMRVGNLAARSTDGEFQANFSTNSFMGRIKVFNMLGCCPYNMRNMQVEFSPINEVAHAIVLLSTTPKECTVFHPYNIHSQFLGDVLQGLNVVGDGVRFVEQEDFAQAMERAKNDPQMAKQMASLLAYQDLAHGKKTTDVKRDNDYTTQVLYRLGFAWSPTSWDYVERMLNAISSLGFFDM